VYLLEFCCTVANVREEDVKIFSETRKEAFLYIIQCIKLNLGLEYALQ